jgi:hypothetical protein
VAWTSSPAAGAGGRLRGPRRRLPNGWFFWEASVSLVSDFFFWANASYRISRVIFFMHFCRILAQRAARQRGVCHLRQGQARAFVVRGSFSGMRLILFLLLSHGTASQSRRSAPTGSTASRSLPLPLSDRISSHTQDPWPAPTRPHPSHRARGCRRGRRRCRRR